MQLVHLKFQFTHVTGCGTLKLIFQFSHDSRWLVRDGCQPGRQLVFQPMGLAGE
jgi:hypothetical protein